MKTYSQTTLTLAVLITAILTYALTVGVYQVASSIEHSGDRMTTHQEAMAALAAWEEAHPDEDLD